MKQKDYLIIAIFVFMGAILSFGVGKLLIGGPKAVQQAEVVQPISADFPLPDKKYFNSDAIDPTRTIQIQDNNNVAPFDGVKAQ